MADDKQQGWMTVSHDGFKEMNADRPFGQVLKELVQNGLDALPPEGGRVELEIRPPGDGDKELLVICRDTGGGIENVEDVRSLYFTGKKDSHLKRGRFGRGFKEALSLATSANVESTGGTIWFLRDGATGEPYTQLGGVQSDHPGGTVVRMTFDRPDEDVAALESYFQTFLPPDGVTFTVNGTVVVPAKVKHVVEGSLTTEVFENGRWKKNPRKTIVRLVETDGEPLIYEMGIPVCSAEWDQPYGLDVGQRVPMNPNRDSTMSGFPAKLHRLALPVLLDELDADAARTEWVAEAAVAADPEVQQRVLRKAYGANIVRSTPSFGKFSTDDDARERGVSVLDTRQLSPAFQTLAKTYAPTSREYVAEVRRQEVARAAEGGMDVDDAYDVAGERAARIRELTEARGGRDRVKACLAWFGWFCEALLDAAGEPGGSPGAVTVTPAILRGHLAEHEGGRAIATWSAYGSRLAVGLDTPELWDDPAGAFTLSVLIHETAHEAAAHHGRSFAEEVERLAGHAAVVMLTRHQVASALVRAIGRAEPKPPEG